MPELPEVETVCRAIIPLLEGHTIIQVKQNRANLRYPFPATLAEELTRSRVIKVHRRAKYILVNFQHGTTLIWHLGMSGRVITEKAGESNVKVSPHDHIILTSSADFRITYRDPRRFGFMLLAPTKELENMNPFRLLGPEPLDEVNLCDKTFYDCLKDRSIPLKQALINQNIIAGLGNIYAAESLWQAKLSPFRLTNTLTLSEVAVLLREIRDVLRKAINAGGSTLRDHAQPNGDIGYFQHCFSVYNQNGKQCKHCVSTTIIKVIQNGRSTYYCPLCQK